MNNIKPKGVGWALLGVLLLCAALYASNAKGETNLFVGAWSKHLISSSDNLNERHDLLAIEHNKWIAGRFVNSYNRNTVFAGRKWAWSYGKLSAGVYGGAMLGYRSCYGDNGSNAKLCPMAAPFVTWDTGVVNPQLFLLGEALAISARLEF